VTGLSAFYWISAWGIFFDANHREPTSPAEVAAALGLNRRTVFNWQQAFRKVFPEYRSPAIVWDLVHDQARSDDPHVLGLQLGAAEL